MLQVQNSNKKQPQTKTQRHVGKSLSNPFFLFKNSHTFSVVIGVQNFPVCCMGLGRIGTLEEKGQEGKSLFDWQKSALLENLKGHVRKS